MKNSLCRILYFGIRFLLIFSGIVCIVGFLFSLFIIVYNSFDTYNQNKYYVSSTYDSAIEFCHQYDLSNSNSEYTEWFKQPRLFCTGPNFCNFDIENPTMHSISRSVPAHTITDGDTVFCLLTFSGDIADISFRISAINISNMYADISIHEVPQAPSKTCLVMFKNIKVLENGTGIINFAGGIALSSTGTGSFPQTIEIPVYKNDVRRILDYLDSEKTDIIAISSLSVAILSFFCKKTYKKLKDKDSSHKKRTE